jgi:hypothetical protein
VPLAKLAGMVAEVSGRNPEVIIRTRGLAAEYTADNALLLNEIGAFGFRQMAACIKELYTWYETQERDIDRESLRFDN